MVFNKSHEQQPSGREGREKSKKKKKKAAFRAKREGEGEMGEDEKGLGRSGGMGKCISRFLNNISAFELVVVDQEEGRRAKRRGGQRRGVSQQKRGDRGGRIERDWQGREGGKWRRERGGGGVHQYPAGHSTSDSHFR